MQISLCVGTVKLTQIAPYILSAVQSTCFSKLGEAGESGSGTW